MSDAFLMDGGTGENRPKKMAKDRIGYICYSERGIISYLMFRMFENEIILRNFLNSIFNYKKKNPFKKKIGHAKNPKALIRNIRIFSEMNLGRFGNPDAILYLEIKYNDCEDWKKHLFFIEAKYIENWIKSNKRNKSKEYADTIKGQLALKKRVLEAFENGKNKIIENIDKFYVKQGDSNRKKRSLDLKRNPDLKLIFNKYFLNVDKSHIYYVACTNEKEEKNPLTEKEVSFLKSENEQVYWISMNNFIGNQTKPKKTMTKLRRLIENDLN